MTADENKVIAIVNADLKDLLPGYLKRRHEDIKTMQRAKESGDFGAIRILGHGMKGSGGGYGFDTITEIGRSIEKAAGIKDTEKIQKCIDELQNYLEKVEIVFVEE